MIKTIHSYGLKYATKPKFARTNEQQIFIACEEKEAMGRVLETVPVPGSETHELWIVELFSVATPILIIKKSDLNSKVSTGAEIRVQLDVQVKCDLKVDKVT